MDLWYQDQVIVFYQVYTDGPVDQDQVIVFYQVYTDGPVVPGSGNSIPPGVY